MQTPEFHIFNIEENIKNIHAEIFNSDFLAFRHSVESNLDLDYHGHFPQPQMTSHLPRFSSPLLDPYSNYNYEDENDNRKNQNKQRKNKPNYPKAPENTNYIDTKNSVPEEEIIRRIPKNEKKRVLFESDNLNEKMKEIEKKFKWVIFGKEQMMVTFWMESIQRIFKDSEKENNYEVFKKLNHELFNIGIKLNDIDKKFLQNSSLSFEILEYDKEIDSEYIPPMKMFVPYLGIN